MWEGAKDGKKKSMFYITTESGRANGMLTTEHCRRYHVRLYDKFSVELKGPGAARWVLRTGLYMPP